MTNSVAKQQHAEEDRPADAIPLVDLKAQYRAIGGEIEAAMHAVVERADFILGREVTDFENEFAAYCGAAHGVGCGSGTEALHLGMKALGIGPGDEVIMPAMTFVATALAITMCGARPVLVDVDADTALIDPALIEGAITGSTRAILPVHLYGQCADMDPILEIAGRRGLKVIEDAAQAHGAIYQGRRAGSMGDVGCFSFYPGKNLGAYGDGGLITTDDAEAAERIRLLRNWGSTRKYHHEIVAVNSRLDTIQAAVLGIKLGYLEGWNAARRQHAARYDEALGRLAGVRLNNCAAGAVHHLYVIRVDGRDAVLERLNAACIGAGIHYPFAVHQQPAYAHLGYGPGAFPVSEDWAHNCLSLPIYAELPGDACDRAAAVLGTIAG